MKLHDIRINIGYVVYTNIAVLITEVRYLYISGILKNSKTNIFLHCGHSQYVYNTQVQCINV